MMVPRMHVYFTVAAVVSDRVSSKGGAQPSSPPPTPQLPPSLNAELSPPDEEINNAYKYVVCKRLHA